MVKKIFLITVVSCCTGSMYAQFVYDYLKAADNYFQKGDYASAAGYYEKYLGKDKNAGNEVYPYTPQRVSKKTAPEISSREKALFNLAESYRLLNYPEKAKPVYQEVINANKGGFPLAQYHHASLQRAMGIYDSAEIEFKSFLAGYSTTDQYKQGAERELKNLDFIKTQVKRSDLKYYSVKKAPPELNTTGASYAPVWLNNGTLLFTSTRPLDTAAKVKEYTNRVYQAAYSEGNLSGINKTGLPQDKNIQQGVVSVTPDGNTLFLTRWTVNANQKSAAIYTSTRKGEEWSDPEKLDETINVPGANTQQPSVTPDGNYLIYASDRSGGQGGYDIWYADLKDGKPSNPRNMGSAINTSLDEQAPFYHAASESLIFSANGRVGMGGYDFFQSKGNFGNWSEPVNMGYPVNSVKDDIYLVSRGGAKNVLEDVMLSSDRDASCCLELFFLKKIRPLKQVSGKVVSCNPAKPLKGATVTVVDANDKVVFTRELGTDGTYSFTLEDHLAVKVKADADSFISNSVQVPLPADVEEEKFTYPDLCLLPVPPKKDETFVVENVYYDFNSAVLKPESFPALDEIARMLNYYPAMVIEIGAHTDNIGSDDYNQKLSEARAKSVVEYLINTKQIAAERLQSKGYGETMPIAENRKDGKDNPEGRAKNRRTEFKVIKSE